MTPGQARALIEIQLDGIYANIDVAWPNAPFTTPDAGSSWVKVDFIWGDGFLWTKDGRDVGLNLVRGILQLQTYGPKDVGDGDIYDVHNLARPFLNRRRLAGADSTYVVFGACSGPRLSFEDPWRVLTLSAPFSFVELVPVL